MKSKRTESQRTKPYVKLQVTAAKNIRSATIMRTSGISIFTVSTGTGTQRSNLFMYSMARLIFWWVERYVLSSGDGIFINSQVIHRFEAEDSAIIPNIVFSPVLLAPQGSLIYSRYIGPIIESTTECVIFSAEETAHHSIIETMRSVFAVQSSGTASEMETVELLLKLWRLLYESIQITDCGPVSGHSAQTQAKLQIMMQYIHDNYSGQITLDDIAGTVLISKSSVLNIFRIYLHTSPINYVVEYRLKRASKLLVDTENSVCAIAHETGFENIGYFCRRFKKLYGVTPINYRKYYRSAERNSMRNIQSDTNVLSG